jgi:hypothetical protein
VGAALTSNALSQRWRESRRGGRDDQPITSPSAMETPVSLEHVGQSERC